MRGTKGCEKLIFQDLTPRLRDFRNFAREKDIAILREVAINTHRLQETGNIVTFLPNLRATYGIFLIGRGDREDAG